MSGNVTFFCGGKQVPASRFRVDPISDFLASQGWEPQTVYGYGPLDQKLGNGIPRRAYRAACRVKRYITTSIYQPNGPVVVQRLAWPWYSGAEISLAKRAGGFVFDFDDSVFLASNGAVSSSRDKALKSLFEVSNKVVAGNSWLADYASDYCDVEVVPTCIDTRKYLPKESVDNIEPVIGWIGTSGNFPYLRQLVDPLARLRAEGFKFKVVLCSDVRDDQLLKLLGADFIKWSSEGELATLQSFDIGLMPLFDDDWCRGKCSFKMIQYMAVGVPPVGSAVGFNNDVIADGQTGFLVKGDEWFLPLRELLSDQDLRKFAGRQARSRAVDLFDVSVAGLAYQRILDGL